MATRRTHQNIWRLTVPKKMSTTEYAKGSRIVVPVYIRDFLGDYTDVSTHSMKKVFDSFDQRYCEEHKADCIQKLYDGINIELLVKDIDYTKTTYELLQEINYEGAMKMLPT